MKPHRYAGYFLGLSLILGLFIPSCSIFIPTATKTYTLETQPLDLVDKTIDYRPGFVKPTGPQDVEVDALSGLEAVKQELLVVLKKGETDTGFLRELSNKGVKVILVGYVPTFRTVQLHWAEVDPDPTEVIKALPQVLKVQRHFIKKVQQASQKTQVPGEEWYIKAFDMPNLWVHGKGAGVTIATLDSGLDLTLPTWTGRVVHPYSVINGTPEFQDVIFTRKGNAERVINHGTQVASMAAGLGGVAPLAKVMPIQVVGYNLLRDNLITNDLTLLEGLARAMAYGADIINISLGTDLAAHYSKDGSGRLVLKTTIDNLKKIAVESSQVFEEALTACEKRKILVVCAAGNDSLISAGVQPLASSGKTIVVGAIGKDLSVAPFSNRGPEVDCYAPGLALNLQGAGGSFWSASGTSYAAPFVSGILALGLNPNYKMPVSTTKQMLKKTNFEGRSSILGKSTPIFFPGEYLTAMGKPVKASQNLVESYREFKELYGNFFVVPGEDQATTLKKIVGYYSVRNEYSEGEPEYKLGLSFTPKYYRTLIDIMVSRGAGDYFSAIFLSHAPLSQSQVSDCMVTIPITDYGGIVASWHNFRPAVPALLKRLIPKDSIINDNTLSALGNLGDRSIVLPVRQYLTSLHEKSTYSGNEPGAAYILALLAPDENKELILKTYPRYREYDGASFTFNFFHARAMIRALNLIKDPQGSHELVRLLRIAENSLDPKSPFYFFGGLYSDRDSLRISSYIDEIQSTLNPFLPNELKYIKTAPQEVRRKRIEEISTFLKAPEPKEMPGYPGFKM